MSKYVMVTVHTRKENGLILSSIWAVDKRIIGDILDEMMDVLMMKEDLGSRLRLRLEQSGESIEEMMECIRQFDTNRDGLIDRSEFVDILLFLDMHLSSSRLQTLLSLLDDGEGKVRYNTLQNLMSRTQGSSEDDIVVHCEAESKNF